MTTLLRRVRDEAYYILGGINSLVVDGIGSIVRPSTRLYISRHPAGDLAKDYILIGEDLRAVLRRDYGEEETERREAPEKEREYAGV